MPTVDELNVPYITLGYGQNIVSDAGTGNKITNYDKTFHFPTGAYPGQQLILRVLHFPTSYTLGLNTYLFYGDIEIKVPVARTKQIAPNTWQDWYSTYGSINNYYSINSNTDALDAGSGIVKSSTWMLIWDGSQLKVPGSNNQSNAYQPVLLETGWIIHPIAASPSSIAKTGYVWAGPPA